MSSNQKSNSSAAAVDFFTLEQSAHRGERLLMYIYLAAHIAVHAAVNEMHTCADPLTVWHLHVNK